jgi:N-methylhydantoinase A/oxoprolinase/acetone carboxylase beta subunit
VEDGEVHVGPESVGAAPGPACFGLGGTDATITDVYLLMGILDPSTYLGGTMSLDVESSRKAVTANVAEPLGLDVPAALERMEDAYLERVARALRASDLRDDTVVAAFGGAGPMTICGAAAKAGVRRVLVPRTAAVFSAVGIGFSDLSQRYERPLTATDADTVRAVAADLRARADRDMYAEGVAPEDCKAAYRLLVERDGEPSSIELDGSLDPGPHVRDGDVTALELTLVAPLPHVGLGAAGAVQPAAATSDDTRTVGEAELPVYALVDQPPGAEADGPAVIEGPFFTMRLPGGWRFRTTAAGDLELTEQRSD